VAGATSASYVDSTLHNNDSVWVVVTDPLSCAASDTGVSNHIIILAGDTLVPSVSITASATILCGTASSTFTANAVNGGNAPGYQWYKDGVAVPGATGAIYHATSLTNNDSVWARLASSLPCAVPDSVYSNHITVAVGPAVPPAISITAAATSFCGTTGFVDTFWAMSAGSAVLTYRWYKDGSPVSGATAPSYIDSSLQNNDSIWVVATAIPSCSSPDTAVSNHILINIGTTLVPAVGIAGSVSICPANIDSFHAAPVNGGATPQYQWYVNGIPISGATGAMYSDSALNNNDSVWVELISSLSCAVPDTAESGHIAVTVGAAVAPAVNISASATTLCGVTADTFSATPANGGATPHYQWYKNGIAIPGASASVFITGSLTNNDSIWARLTSSLPCAAPDTAISNHITVAAGAAVTPTVSITASATSFCGTTGYVDTFRAASSGSAVLTYRWYKDGTIIPGATSASYTSAAINNNDSIWAVATANPSCVSPDSGVSNKIYLAVTGCTDTVWPGDADANHMVDNNDLLPIGLAYDSSGPVRAVQNIVWQGDSAMDWSQYFTAYSPAVNYNNADCDGNGMVNSDDTLAISQNYGLTHAKYNGYVNNWRSGIPALTLAPSRDTVYGGDTLITALILGSAGMPVSSIYGLAFTLHFNLSFTDTNSIALTYLKSWLGSSADRISILHDDMPSGTIQTAITGINHLNRMGYGPIGTLSCIITTDNINGTIHRYYPDPFYITNINAIDAKGNAVPLNAGIDTVWVGAYPEGIEVITTQDVYLYPNPAATQVTIATQSMINEIIITDMLGQAVLIKQVNNKQSETIDISHLASGVYTVHISASGGSGTAKLIVNR
jgi:putative hemolysin